MWGGTRSSGGGTGWGDLSVSGDSDDDRTWSVGGKIWVVRLRCRWRWDMRWVLECWWWDQGDDRKI